MFNESDIALRSFWLMVCLKDILNMTLSENEFNVWKQALCKYDRKVVKLAFLRFRKEHNLDGMISELDEYCREFEEIEKDSKQ